MRDYSDEYVSDAYIEKGSTTFLSSDLLREQLAGLDDMMDSRGNGHFAYFSRKDFSATGAARTMELDLKNFVKDIIIKNCFSINSDYIAHR